MTQKSYLMYRVVELILNHHQVGRGNGVTDKAPDCCTIRGAVDRFEYLANAFRFLATADAAAQRVPTVC